MDWQSKRKQDEIDADEVRTFTLKVRLNSQELKILDVMRGRTSRAETIRYLLQSTTPPATPPAINAEAWEKLSRAAGNLNQIAHRLNSGESLDIEIIKHELEVFRSRLLGV